jgi:hypothetical protein
VFSSLASQASSRAATTGYGDPVSGIGTVSGMAARACSVAVSSAVVGVAMTPGATAFGGMAAPAHWGVGAVRRTH